MSSRVSEVYKRQYTRQRAMFSDVFPKSEKGGGGESVDYIIERTLFRPRDAIQFANECFRVAFDRPRISWRAIYAAEASYSSKRLKSLAEEWSEYYPALEDTVEILRGLRVPFTRSTLSGDRLSEIAMELHEASDRDACSRMSRQMYSAESKYSEADLISQILICLYHVGVIGIKISTLDTYIWSHIDQPRISKSEVKRANQIVVHKMFRHALEIQA